MPTYKRVLLLNADYNTIEIRVLKIARSLFNNGFDVDIITWNRSEYITKRYGLNDINIIQYGYLEESNELKNIALGYLYFYAFFIKFYLKNHNYDAIHIMGIYLSLPVLLMKFLYNFKFIYDITDYAADSYNTNKYISIFLELIENTIMLLSDGIIVVDKSRLNEINKSSLNKVCIIMNTSVDIQNNIIKNNKEELYMYYGGWITQYRGYDFLISAVSELKNVKLYLAGYGPYEKYVIDKIKKLNNVFWLGKITKNESLIWTKKSNLLVAFYDPIIKIHRKASSNKVFDAMMCSTPIISNKESLSISHILNDEKCGIVVPYGDKSYLQEKIITLHNCPNLLTKMGERGYHAFKKKYNWVIMEKRLLKFYISILKDK